MTHETVFRLEQGRTGLRIEAAPEKGEDAIVGRLIDTLTATGSDDKLRPAAPDSHGVIERICSPEISRERAAGYLAAQGFPVQM